METTRRNFLLVSAIFLLGAMTARCSPPYPEPATRTGLEEDVDTQPAVGE